MKTLVHVYESDERFHIRIHIPARIGDTERNRVTRANEALRTTNSKRVASYRTSAQWACR